MIIKPLFVIAFTFLLFFSCETSLEDPCTYFDQLDSKMLAITSQVNEKHSGDRAFLEDFKMEQVLWIQYRDRRLRAMYPRSWDNFYRKKFGRKEFNTCKCQEMVRMAKVRITDLEMYINGSPAGQADCPSMLNNKQLSDN